jgi:hypothetical protein
MYVLLCCLSTRKPKNLPLPWMRGEDRQAGSLFSYVDLEARVAEDRPLPAIRTIVDGALGELSGELEGLYSRGNVKRFVSGRRGWRGPGCGSRA